MFRQLGSCVLLQTNMDGISKAKSEQLSKILAENNIGLDIIVGDFNIVTTICGNIRLMI